MAATDHIEGAAPCVERARPSNTAGAINSTASKPCDLPDAASPLLRLPRELRDQIYDYVFSIPDTRGDRALRIERRHLRYFTPTAATILLILHHEDLLLNSQISSEALEVLLKKHTVYLSCGPFVLKTLLSRIEEQGNLGKRWLKWMSKIELDWVTFPNLRMYPPERANGKDEWWWENDGQEVDVDYIRGAQYNGHYDEYDYEGSCYDDNLYEPSDTQLYPAFTIPARNQPFVQPPDPADPFGFATHYPFSDPERAPGSDNEGEEGQTTSQDEIATKLELLVEMEVTPLFTYLASPVFALSSLTLPLYFISKQTYHHRNTSRPGYGLPLKLRYWVAVVVHALNLLSQPTTSKSPLAEVRVKYLPWDIWASMDPSDDLNYMVEKGVWFDGKDADDRPEGEGEAFKAVWDALIIGGVDVRAELDADVRLVKWDGGLDKWRVGDELEVVFTRAK